ncbi:MAG: RecQ family ATP-dependent DNA helicase [Treponema sp.]|nr:RecQ family ATP-dependent DNA helicase [Treponema sp.]
MSNFNETNRCDPLGNAVKQLFSLNYLFPYQRLVIANLLEAAKAAGIPAVWPDGESIAQETDNTDVPEDSKDGESLGRQIVILPTGAGKSLCFQLPAMLLSGPTLVIYPILSLMADQERRLTERGFSPVLIRGGQSDEEREKVWKKILSGESKFIIANPEVLLSPKVQEQLPRLGIIHMVIDEAHCVSEWGESFRPSYLEIHSILRAARPPLVTAFTATASAPVLEKIERYIFGDDGAARKIIGNPDRPNIEYRAKACILRNLAVRDLLLSNLRPAIVFCSSRSGTERLARYLRNNLTETAEDWSGEIRFYHAGLSREEKKELETWYLHNPKAVLVSTCAFGLGVDKADIRTVIHRDCPPSVEAYLQESGRAGRDGQQSMAILLWGPDDSRRLKQVTNMQDKLRFEQLFGYAGDVVQCRREALLRLLNYAGTGEKPAEHCCDVCSGEGSTELREEQSLKDFFRRNRRCYTVDEGARILAKLASWSEGEAGEAIRELLKKGTLAKCRGPFWKNKLISKTHSPPKTHSPH